VTHTFISKVIVNIILFFSMWDFLFCGKDFLKVPHWKKVRRYYTYSSINGYYTSKNFKHECMAYFLLWAYHSLVQYFFFFKDALV
jgi:hypothetical protein